MVKQTHAGMSAEHLPSSELNILVQLRDLIQYAASSYTTLSSRDFNAFSTIFPSLRQNLQYWPRPTPELFHTAPVRVTTGRRRLDPARQTWVLQ